MMSKTTYIGILVTIVFIIETILLVVGIIKENHLNRKSDKVQERPSIVFIILGITIMFNVALIIGGMIGDLSVIGMSYNSEETIVEREANIQKVYMDLSRQKIVCIELDSEGNEIEKIPDSIEYEVIDIPKIEERRGLAGFVYLDKEYVLVLPMTYYELGKTILYDKAEEIDKHV